MPNTDKKHRKRAVSLSYRLPVIFVLSCFIIILIFTVILYFKFQSRMIKDYDHMAEGATNLMILELNPDHIDDYIEENFQMAEYNHILERFYDIRDCYPDILYMYVHRLTPEGGIVVFDLNSPDGIEDANSPGDFYEFGDLFMVHMDDLLAGKDVPGLSGPTDDGYIITYCKPVYDSEGNLQCHACVDFSLDELRREDLNFMVSIILISGIVTVIIMVFAIIWMRHRITRPLNKMSKATEQFTYQSRDAHLRNIQIMEKLNICTNDEIEAVYRTFISVMKQTVYYAESLDKAESDIRSKDEQIGQMSIKAFKDALTSVGNKAAFNSLAAELDEMIRKETAEFAIVMLDANNLKAINDNYGHEKGDLYLKGCCRMICEKYRKSPVFRVGGDEFVAVLRGHDYENRDELMNELTEVFASLTEKEELEPWERFSMSIGMADYIPDDENVESVLRRADGAMYIRKTAFKRKYGSYR